MLRTRLRAPWSRYVLALALIAGPGLLGCGSTSAAKGGDDAKAEGEDGPKGLEPLEERAHAVVEAPPPPASEAFTLRGGVVMTATGHRWDPGYVVVENGRIAAVGEGEPPSRVGRVVDVSGHVVTPGLIDVHSHLGVYPQPSVGAHMDGNEATSPNTAGVWAEHGFWPEDPGLERASAGGITTLEILPGSANLIGGRGVILHLRPMRSARAMRFPGAPDTVKMACGENPKRVYGRKGSAPMTRMGNGRGFRAAFAAARAWLEENRDKPVAKVKRDLEMETLAGVLTGRILVQVHCYRADDMLTFLQVADEFGISVRAFHHALEAYKIRDVLAARKIGVATWADWWGFKMEAYDGIPENLALVDEAGGRAIVHSDSPEGIQRLNQEAAKGLASGRAAGVSLDEDKALRWITANPAWALGVDAEVGTLEVG
ncbi:MAG: hypothetical protein KC635_09815, partial [Myxococcales bacterium]|nr:hypothetical protein [Myxococcales bacterium]